MKFFFKSVIFLFVGSAFAQTELGLNPNKGLGLNPGQGFGLRPEVSAQFKMYVDFEKERMELQQKIYEDQASRVDPKMQKQFADLTAQFKCLSPLKVLVENSVNGKSFIMSGENIVISDGAKTKIYSSKGVMTVDGRSCEFDNKKTTKDAIAEIFKTILPDKSSEQNPTDTYKKQLRNLARKHIDTFNSCNEVYGSSDELWKLMKDTHLIESGTPAETVGKGATR